MLRLSDIQITSAAINDPDSLRRLARFLAAIRWPTCGDAELLARVTEAVTTWSWDEDEVDYAQAWKANEAVDLQAQAAESAEG